MPGSSMNVRKATPNPIANSRLGSKTLCPMKKEISKRGGKNEES